MSGRTAEEKRVKLHEVHTAYSRILSRGKVFNTGESELSWCCYGELEDWKKIQGLSCRRSTRFIPGLCSIVESIQDQKMLSGFTFLEVGCNFTSLPWIGLHFFNYKIIVRLSFLMLYYLLSICLSLFPLCIPRIVRTKHVWSSNIIHFLSSFKWKMAKHVQPSSINIK